MTPPTPRRYAGLSGDQRAALRRESLLEAGLDVFAATGKGGATMTAICAHAKLTERYFYESFTSRDELLQKVLDGIATRSVRPDWMRFERAPGRSNNAYEMPSRRSSPSSPMIHARDVLR